MNKKLISKCCGAEVKKCVDYDNSYDCSKCGRHLFDYDLIPQPIQKEEVKTATEMMVNDMQEEEYYRIKHTSSDTFIEGGLMEKLADIEHQRWSDWQKWVHSKCVKASLKDGHLESKEYGEAYFIPPILYDRWERQIKTPYSELSEKEKESDREQVRRYLPLLKSSLQEQKQSILEEIEKLPKVQYGVYGSGDLLRDIKQLLK